MDKHINPKDLLPFLEDVSRRAGDLILSYHRGEFHVNSKNLASSGIDIVTDADLASEELILKAINKEFPDHDVITEETEVRSKGSRWKWLVDPLDGTVNFAHGYPCFSVSIALMEGDELLAGIVRDPLRDESFCSLRGGSAFLNGNLIRVSQAQSLNRTLVATGFPYDRAVAPDNNVAEFSRVVTQVQGLRRGGSAAMDLAYVACGRLDAFWELKLKPWDMAAGMLLVQEAGGKITDRHGSPTGVETASIVASNGLVHDLLLELLAEV
ncbi:MAG: inositol monophosphatase [Deltaproteobacteria bacterium]|nr:inositol monophosphatase [Deltaproteobacteria bacterium]